MVKLPVHILINSLLCGLFNELSATETTERRIMEWLKKISKRCVRKRSWTNMRYYPSICLEVFFHWLYSPRGPWPLFQFHGHFTDDRTPWTSDQLVARPLPKHRTTQTQNKRIRTPNIHALCGIRTHDPSVRASEYSSCLRPLGYCDRLCLEVLRKITNNPS
jgi:hypothetical protein